MLKKCICIFSAFSILLLSFFSSFTAFASPSNLPEFECYSPTFPLSHYDYNFTLYPYANILCYDTVYNQYVFFTYSTTYDYLNRGIYQYTNISEADSKKGQIRCDVNVSVSKNDILGVKVETKNVNSFSAVRDVISYEVKRQIECIENNIPIEQETRRWNEEKMCTEHMRSKVDAIDYRYFVEPNIPKFLITEEFKEEIKKEIPEQRFAFYKG